MIFFEAVDKAGRRIYLTRERWSHINQEHPEVSPYLMEFDAVLQNPTKIVEYPFQEQVWYYYRYFKQRPSPSKYLLIIVKYLNGEGFIVTAYFVRTIP